MSKPLDHPDYEFAPGCFNFSKWSRENIPKPPPKLKVGDMATLTVEVEVRGLHKDCDGTPLYSLYEVSGLWGDDSLEKLEKPDE